MGQTDGRIALFQNAPLGRRGHNKRVTAELSWQHLRRSARPSEQQGTRRRSNFETRSLAIAADTGLHTQRNQLRLRSVVQFSSIHSPTSTLQRLVTDRQTDTGQ